MQLGILRRGMEVLLAAFVLVSAVQTSAEVRQVERGTAQAARSAASASSGSSVAPLPSSVLLRWQPYPGAVR